MIAALILLAAALATAVPALLAIGYRHVRLVERTAPLAQERDRARADLAQRTDELELQIALNRTLSDDLAAARKENTRARIARVANAAPDDVGAAVDELLAERLLADAARADRGAAAPAAVPGPGAATDGPRPTWVPEG